MSNSFTYDSLKKEELNEILPYQTIVRLPQNQSLEDVGISYHRNMVELNEFISEAFGQKSNNPNLDKILNNQDDFNNWILECHRIACLGKNNNRIYSGRSNSSSDFDIRKMSSRFRENVNYHVKATLNMDNSETKIAYATAKKLDDPLANDLNFTFWAVKQFFNDSMTTYQTGDITLTEIPDKSDLIGEPEFGEYIPNFSGNILYFSRKDFECSYFYPGSKFIKEYLKRMRNKLNETFSEINKGNDDLALKKLANYYQTGIRSQAVITVWNSVLMSQVNNLINHMGHNRIPHESHDYNAFLLVNENSFEQYFRDRIIENKDLYFYLNN